MARVSPTREASSSRRPASSAAFAPPLFPPPPLPRPPPSPPKLTPPSLERRLRRPFRPWKSNPPASSEEATSPAPSRERLLLFDRLGTRMGTPGQFFWSNRTTDLWLPASARAAADAPPPSGVEGDSPAPTTRNRVTAKWPVGRKGERVASTILGEKKKGASLKPCYVPENTVETCPRTLHVKDTDGKVEVGERVTEILKRTCVTYELPHVRHGEEISSDSPSWFDIGF